MKSIGMDVHARQTYFCVIDGEGRKVEQGKTETKEEALREVIQRHKGDGVQVAIEATTTSGWVQEVLKGAGAKVEVTNPYKVKLISESRAKTDKADALILAELLRCGGLPTPVYVPSVRIRKLRKHITLRRGLIQIRTRLICNAKAHFRGEGISSQQKDFHTSKSWERQIRENSASRWYLGPLFEVYQKVESSLKAVEEAMDDAWSFDESVLRLQTIPGVGRIVAYTIVASLGEVERFSCSKQVAAYAGLVPTERSSGEVVVRSGITHEGRSELRGALVQAGWAVLRTKKDEAQFLKRFYYKLMHKRGSQIAVVALARKLLTIAYQVLKGESDFDGQAVQEIKKPEKLNFSQKRLLNLSGEQRNEVGT